jgi:hypothetical protein
VLNVYEVQIGDGVNRDTFFVTARNWKEASQKALAGGKQLMNENGWDVISVSRRGQVR